MGNLQFCNMKSRRNPLAICRIWHNKSPIRFAIGTTPALWSVTVPRILPYNSSALADGIQTHSMATRTSTLTIG